MKKFLAKLAVTTLAIAMFLGIGALGTTVQAASAPAKVSGLKVAVRDDDELTLKWTKVSGATGYQIYRYDTSTGKWKKIKTTSKNRYEVENLTSATKYKFKVRAYTKSNGKTTFGSYSATLTTYTEPEEVENLKASAKTTTSVTLKWSKVSRATKYQVYIYDTAQKKYVRKTTVSGTSATISGLSSGTTYKFKVRAYLLSDSGKNKYYGDFSDVYKVTTTAKSSSSTSSSSTYIGTAKAKSIALTDAGATESQVYDLEVEKDKENGVVVYEVSFDYNGYEYDYTINATSGKILEKEVDRD
ncbi:MAG: fibronectin type III domain-containing protein [Lachnospiraceae bacterium]|nr:fibronectin type III domain-containing protein [Lachnospiraceae bacterium]